MPNSTTPSNLSCLACSTWNLQADWTRGPLPCSIPVQMYKLQLLKAGFRVCCVDKASCIELWSQLEDKQRTNNDCLLKAVLLWIGLWCPRFFKWWEEVEEPCHIFVIFLQMQPCSRSCHNIPHKHMSGFLSGFVHKCYVHYCWQDQRPLRISKQDN